MVFTSRGPEPGGPHETAPDSPHHTSHHTVHGRSRQTAPGGPQFTSHYRPRETSSGSGRLVASRSRRPWRVITDPAVLMVLGRATAAVNREARRRPALSAILVAAGLGAVVVSVAGPGAAAPEFRTPAAVATATPSVQVSAAAVYTGLAPYAPPAPVESRPSPRPRTPAPVGRSGLPSPIPSVTGEDAAVLSGVLEPSLLEPSSEKTPLARTFPSSAGATTAVATPSVTFGEPREGDSVTAATAVSGTADLPGDHQVWLLSRHGSGAYRIEGACRGARSFSCGPPSLESGGEDTFQLTTIVVGPSTARTLRAGEVRDTLPAHLARSEVTVRRAAP